MKTYKTKIKFVTKYLQARFSENAKQELENYVSQGIVKSDEDSWAVLLHQDEEGIYIPSIQVRNAMINAGKEFKLKKQRRSLQQWVISNIMIEPSNIQLGFKVPQEIIVSYPARKDGNRVTIKHPAFAEGLEVEFTIKSLDETMELKAIHDVLIAAGKNYGIGARRRDMFGRFEVISFNLVP